MKLAALFTAAALTFSAAGAALADSTALIIDIAPWGMKKDGGGVAGHYADIATAMGDVAGLPTKLRLVPYTRAQGETGKNSAAFSIMTESEEIKAQAVSAGHLLDLEVVVMTQAGKPISSLSDLAGMSVAKIKGTHLVPALDTDRSIKLREPRSTPQQLEAFLTGQVDAIVGVPQDFQFALAEVKKGNPANLSTAETYVVNTIPVYAWVSKAASEDYLAAITKATAEVTGTGTVARILGQ